LAAQDPNLGPIVRSVLKVERSARHVAQLVGTDHNCAPGSHLAPGIDLQSSLKRHSALIIMRLFDSSSSTATATNQSFRRYVYILTRFYKKETTF
jgi:hypothetical protein